MRIPSFIKAVAASALGALALGAVPVAWAQAYPQKPIRLIVPAPAGSAPDVIARILGDKMNQSMGQPVLVDNKPGAGGIIAMNLLKQAPPDGYTLALPQAAVATVTPLTYKEATYDIEPIFLSYPLAGAGCGVAVAG